MKDITINSIKGRVRELLGLNYSSNQLAGFGDVDTLGLDQVIESHIIPSCKEVIRLAPYNLFKGAKLLTNTPAVKDITRKWGVGANALYVYQITLPADYFRMVSVAMKGWFYAVEAGSERMYDIWDNRPNRRKCNKWGAGLIGTPQHPAAVVRVSELLLSDYQLELHTSPENATLEYLLYVPEPQITGGNINICEGIEDAVILCTAYHTTISLNQPNQASEFASDLRREFSINLPNNPITSNSNE